MLNRRNYKNEAEMEADFNKRINKAQDIVKRGGKYAEYAEISIKRLKQEYEERKKEFA